MTSWGGTLGNLVEGIGGSALGQKLIEAVGPAVLGTMVEQLNANGMGAKVNSWLGQGDNQPITADEIRQGLGNAKLQEVAKQLGLPIDAIADVLAKNLPIAVNQAAKQGLLDGKATGQP
ncbi:YidB family protein [Lichenihabitans sp. Uapishka_5]|uniref:YidB family protein n=1 Tax=Lichenihabitans sp. Uapishka_5 TaxID=3037302 RepID=UPI0029E7D54A|nr:YidB family protein [Lichenihabitans sp. Uapishka_5]MDX7950018.1 YidB family protein [Lichenihabitans sp. Uapishka_5]